MAAPGQRDYEISFARIGRCNPDRGTASMVLNTTVNDGPAAAVAEDLIEAVYEHARPHIASSVLEVSISYGSDEDPGVPSVDQLDGATGLLIVGGCRNAGEFSVREVTAR